MIELFKKFWPKKEVKQYAYYRDAEWDKLMLGGMRVWFYFVDYPQVKKYRVVGIEQRSWELDN